MPDHLLVSSERIINNIRVSREGYQTVQWQNLVRPMTKITKVQGSVIHLVGGAEELRIDFGKFPRKHFHLFSPILYPSHRILPSISSLRQTARERHMSSDVTIRLLLGRWVVYWRHIFAKCEVVMVAAVTTVDCSLRHPAVAQPLGRESSAWFVLRHCWCGGRGTDGRGCLTR